MMNRFGKFVNGMVEIYSAPIDPETGVSRPKDESVLLSEGWKKILRDFPAPPGARYLPHSEFTEYEDHIVEKTVWTPRDPSGNGSADMEHSDSSAS